MPKTTTSKLSLCFFLSVFLLSGSFASTIIPFHHLGEMTDASTLVVLAKAGAKQDVQDAGGITSFQTPLTVQFVVKGEVAVGTSIFIKHWSAKGKGWIKAVADDLALKENETYLIFLAPTNDGRWQPLLISYGVFQQFHSPAGQNLLAPLMEAASLNILHPTDGLPIEPLAVYRQDDLLYQLRDLSAHGSTWDGQKAIETLDVAGFWEATVDRAPPAHCTYFQDGGVGFRWEEFPELPVTVLYANGGDASCSSDPTIVHSYTSTAAASMNGSYTGINLLDGGTTGFTPNCVDGSAVEGNFYDFFDFDNIVVQYNDPCNEIANLTGCSGTLAIGGLSGFTPTHTYDGNPYYSGAYGYVIVNNGACCLSGTNYTLMLTHEMTHSLGVDHIAGSMTANMNPSCCSPITSLDVACVNYLYPLALPVALTDFRGIASANAIQLAWSTASELNNLKFDVERSANGLDFKPIATVAGNGNSDSQRSYSSVDNTPLHGVNYYRLLQIDLDGTYHYSKAIAVYFSAGSPRFEAIPNPVLDSSLRLFTTTDNSAQGEVFLTDLQGRLLLNEPIEVGRGETYTEINLPPLPTGQYLVKLVMDGSTRLARFTKN